MKSTGKATAAAVCAALLLGGCTTTRAVVGPLPDLDRRLATDFCGHKAAKAGEHARVVAKRFNAERACEKWRADTVVKHYKGLQASRK